MRGNGLFTCKAEEWNGVVEFTNFAEVDPIKVRLEKENGLNFADDMTIVMEKNSDGSYVVRKDAQNGNGVLIVSAINTNSIFEGAFEDNLLNENPILTIWSKNEGTALANQYQRIFFCV